jgi:hypothetical protein
LWWEGLLELGVSALWNGEVLKVTERDIKLFEVNKKCFWCNIVMIIYKERDIRLFEGWGRHGRYRMVVGFTTTYAFSAYHH